MRNSSPLPYRWAWKQRHANGEKKKQTVQSGSSAKVWDVIVIRTEGSLSNHVNSSQKQKTNPS